VATAIVIGATGLTGSALIRQLLDDPRFTAVVALTRRPTAVAHPNFREQLIDFGQPATWQDLVRGDVALSALGTTRKDAGSLAAQRIVDVDYQLAFARAAANNGVPSFVLLSSINADPTSRLAYPKMKGELDDAVSALPFAKVRIIRPGFLAGHRTPPRRGETIAIAIANFLAAVGIARELRPIQVDTVAASMIASLFDGPTPRRTYTGSQLFSLTGRR
jgi:uncharacterized protein YbjT (DUF2867 family)